jgi:ATP-dependent protease ClpP protease subunit
MVTKDSAGKATVHMFGTIGADFWTGEGITAKGLIDGLTAVGVEKGAEIEVLIHSPGGDVFEGLAIMGVLNEYATRAVVMGLAASMASVIAVNCDELEMVAGSELMMHNPWMIAAGDAEGLRKQAEHLDQIKSSLVKAYSKRFDEAEVSAIMDAETWMTAEFAVEKGVADRIRAGRPSAMAFVQERSPANKSRFLIAASTDTRLDKMIAQAAEQTQTICTLKGEIDALQSAAVATAAELGHKSNLLQTLESAKAALEKERDILAIRIAGLEQDTARRIALASHEPVTQLFDPETPSAVTAWDKYKAITDKNERAEFYRNNKAEIFRSQPKGA